MVVILDAQNTNKCNFRAPLKNAARKAVKTTTINVVRATSFPRSDMTPSPIQLCTKMDAIVRNQQETNINDVEFLEDLKVEITSKGLANVPWDRVLIMMPSSLASSHLIAAGSWDERKRELSRNVLQEARKNFHYHPRPW